MHLIRRVLALALALLLLLPLALAEPIYGQEAPVYQALLDQFAVGGAYAVNLQAEVKTWPDLSEQSLLTLQDWLKNAQLSLSAHPNAGQSALTLTQKDTSVLSLFTEQGDINRLSVSGADGATTVYVSEIALPWQTLLGVNPILPRFSLALDALKRFAVKALPVLVPYEKPVKTTITIKNVGKGTSQLVYTLKKAEAQEAWASAKPELLPLMEQFADALLPSHAEEFKAALTQLDMNGALTLKRFLDAEGRDLGLQLTGTILLNEQSRKLTLFYGLSDTGLYLSLKLPATRGRDTLELQVSLATKTDRVTGDWRLKQVTGKNTATLTGDLDLKTARGPSGRGVTGEVSALYKTTGEVKTSLSYTLIPDLVFVGSKVDGTLVLSRRDGKTLTHDLLLRLSGDQSGSLQAPAAMAEIHLDGAAQAEIDLAALQLKTRLVSQIKSFLLALPQETRLLVLHDLGREQRTEGESVDIPQNDNLSFTVTEETTTPPTKEDTP